MGIPIIFVHKGNPFFLFTALYEAKISNPDSEIYLIGDETNKHYDFVKYIDYKTLIDDDYNEFIQRYEHMSPNSYDIELFCYLRWFLINNVIKQENISRCFYADSDVMIFQDIEKSLKHYQNYSLSINGISGHNTYICNQKTLQDFCSFMLNSYNKENIHKLKELYATYPRENAICDMTMLSLFKENNEMGELYKIINNKIFDHNINCSDGFEMKNGIKNLKKIENKVVCKLLETNEDIEFITGHFQGGNSKIYMEKYSSLSRFKYILLQLRYNKFKFIKNLRKQFKNNIKSYFKTRINKQDFNPDGLGLFINPFYFARKGLYKHISELAIQISGGKLLDVGCGTKPYKKLFNVEQYDGLEYSSEEYGASKNAEYFYDGNKFPFDNENYDNVISNEVLEHVFNPDEFLSEINRVLKINGKFLLTAPFVWDEHEPPYDFARYTSFGIKYLLEKHGFEIIEFRKSVNNLGVIFQLLNDYIYKKLIKRNKLKHRLIVNALCSVFNILGIILIKITPKNDDLYLDNIILAKKVKNA